MVGKRRYIVVLAALLLALGACAPKTAPTPTPTAIPKAPAPTPVVAAPTPVKISPEDAEWQKVIEAAKKEGKLTLYTAGFLGETGIQVRKAFKERYNIDLEMIAGRGAEFVERLKTERRVGTRVADVLETAALWILEAKKFDTIEVSPGLPALRNKDDFRMDVFADKDGYILIYKIVLRPPIVNTKLVKPEEEPKSWQDMLNPKWKGKMTAANPLVSGGMYTFIPFLNAKEITLDWLRNIGKQDLILVRGDLEQVERVARGEASLALNPSDSYAATYAKEGAPIKAIPMSEGVLIQLGSSLSQVKNAPHPNAAKLFLNWMFSTEGQTIYHKPTGSRSVRKDVPDFTPQALTLPPGSKFVSETVSDLEEASKKTIDKWIIELWK